MSRHDLTLEEKRHMKEAAAARREAKTRTIEERCGTPPGYMAHRRRGENACKKCLRAWAKDTNRRRKQ